MRSGTARANDAWFLRPSAATVVPSQRYGSWAGLGSGTSNRCEWYQISAPNSLATRGAIEVVVDPDLYLVAHQGVVDLHDVHVGCRLGEDTWRGTPAARSISFTRVGAFE